MTRLMILFLLFLLPITHACSTHMSIPEPEAQISTEIVVAKEAAVEKYAAIPPDAPDVPLPEQNQQLPAPTTAVNQQEIAALAEIKEEQESTAPVEIEKEHNTGVPLQNGEKEVVSKETLTASEENAPPPAPNPPEKSDQEMLDAALESCETANYFWERGELDNALNSLDQAYSLILKVSPEDDPEILQQRADLRFTISKRIIEVYTSRFTVANGYKKPIPLVMNNHVERALKLYQGKDRQFFLDAYCRSGHYRPAIVRALKEAGLPEELSWLPLIESGFKIRALSKARALGLWQFIASTGYKFGLVRDQWVDERMDFTKSTDAAIAYLKELHQIFGDWATVLAAYNCGEGRVLKCIRTQRINYLDNFWDLYARLPLETVFYVPKFMAVLHILNDPDAYGFDLPPLEEEPETEEVLVDKQVHLKTVAKHLGVPYGRLQDLNPALRRSCTPNRPYALRVPDGKGEVLVATLEDMPVYRPPVPAYVMHKVRKGECLSLIARRYRTSVRAIMALNGLKRSSYIKVGWRLKVPARRAYSPHRSQDSPAPVHKVQGKTIEYVVRKGDSLWKIANRFATTTRAIQSLNQLHSTRLYIGQILLVPHKEGDLTAVETKAYPDIKHDSRVTVAQNG
ncbi:MAG: LysM peptidoglycan-binding domain-containing protein [Deltaproteobacteria bacterium]|nr:MAG: LysM peptidoglycan-binding domain-containing protein [Deltaproteobacteria bacterium]